MPNMFVEALTISGGKVHDEAREIAIPPESRIAQIQVEPSQTIYKPGEKARIKLKLTGPDGKPFLGSTVVAVYDKAVEYISGGSNVPEIKAFFWSWKTHHQPQTESSLNRWFHNLIEAERNRHARSRCLRCRCRRGIGRLKAMAEMEGSKRGSKAKHGGAWHSGMACSAQVEAAAMAAMAAARCTLSQADLSRRETAGPTRQRCRYVTSSPAHRPHQLRRHRVLGRGLVTAADGTALVDFALPDSLTTWKIKSWTLGPGTKVGQAESEIITSKDLLVRLQAPAVLRREG